MTFFERVHDRCVQRGEALLLLAPPLRIRRQVRPSLLRTHHGGLAQRVELLIAPLAKHRLYLDEPRRDLSLRLLAFCPHPLLLFRLRQLPLRLAVEVLSTLLLGVRGPVQVIEAGVRREIARCLDEAAQLRVEGVAVRLPRGVEVRVRGASIPLYLGPVRRHPLWRRSDNLRLALPLCLQATGRIVLSLQRPHLDDAVNVRSNDLGRSFDAHN